MTNKTKDFFTESRISRSVVAWARKTSFTSHKINLYRVFEIFFYKMSRDNIAERGSAMAFNFTLSMFPSIIFIFTFIPYVPIADFSNKVLDFLGEIIPKNIFDSASHTINDIVSIQHGGLMSFGFLFAILTSTNGARAMITAFNRCYKTSDKRGFFKRIYVACLLVLFLTILIFITVGLSLGFKIYLNYMENHYVTNHQIIYIIAGVFKYMLFFAAFFFSFSLIYYIGPAIIVRWSFFSHGSFVASVLAVIFTICFGFYISSFNAYNKLYGSIGAFIGIMAWLYAISIVLLVGFELNASIDLARREKAGQIRIPLVQI